jgi:hypothetical protein
MLTVYNKREWVKLGPGKIRSIGPPEEACENMDQDAWASIE